jgi:hypothetical protein
MVENDAYLAKLSYYIYRNPLRAKMVGRLADYQWSSYNAYAYKKKKPKWLNINLILSQFSAKDKYRAYRLKVQRYSDEKARIWEDVKHGLFYGSSEFIEKIKSRYLKGRSDAEIPQQNRIRRDINAHVVVRQAALMINRDPSVFIKIGRLPVHIKQMRDMLICHLCKYFGMSNRQVGEIFGLTYSAVSKVVTTFSRQAETNKDLMRKYNMLVSNFKG